MQGNPMKRILSIACAVLIGVTFSLVATPSAQANQSHKCLSLERFPLSDAVFCMDTGVTQQTPLTPFKMRVNWIKIYTVGGCSGDGFENSPALETIDLKILNSSDTAVYTLLGPDIGSSNNCTHTWQFTGVGDCDCVKVGTAELDIRYHFNAKLNGAGNEGGFLNEHWSSTSCC
jgi:hypothetical protein